MRALGRRRHVGAIVGLLVAAVACSDSDTSSDEAAPPSPAGTSSGAGTAPLSTAPPRTTGEEGRGSVPATTPATTRPARTTTAPTTPPTTEPQAPETPIPLEERHDDASVVYFVAPWGHDNNDGTSQQEAWRTLDRVNQADLPAGAHILLARTPEEPGWWYPGPLEFDGNSGGTPEEPIVVSGFGEGEAVIGAGDGTGIMAKNAAGIEIRDLTVSGRKDSNDGWGIRFHTDLPGSGRLDHIVIDNVEVRNFNRGGIELVGWNSLDGITGDYDRGFRDVVITNNEVHDNGQAGISTFGFFENDTNQTGYAHENVLVDGNRVYDNHGQRGVDDEHTGNGIVLASVDGAVIQHNEAFRNGMNNLVEDTGPVGIWTWESNNVVIQFNESYENMTSDRSGGDGGGFGLDGGVTNSVVQFNYSHDNHGPGYLLAQFEGARPLENNVVRYNISENDARENIYGAISIFAFPLHTAGPFQIYNNTVYLSDGSGDEAAVQLSSEDVGVEFRNNVFITDPGLPLVRAADCDRCGTATFTNNLYWSDGSEPTFLRGDAVYAGLDEWRAAEGQELLDGPVGLYADPMLTAPGQGGTVGDTTALNALTAYAPLPASPVLGTGIDTTSFDMPPAERDFTGDPVPGDTGRPLGADR